MFLAHEFQHRGLDAGVADHDGRVKGSLVRDHAGNLSLLHKDLFCSGLHDDPASVFAHPLAKDIGQGTESPLAEQSAASEEDVLEALDAFGRGKGIHRNHEHEVAGKADEKGV